MEEARSYLGAPYLWGGMSERGIDCSGLVHMAWRRLGRLVPRDADQQEEAAQSVDEPRYGDLVTYGLEKATHVAFWVGEGRIVHAAGSRSSSRSRNRLNYGRSGAVSSDSPLGRTPSFELKGRLRPADTECVDAAERRAIMNRYMDHSRRFEAAAAKRSTRQAEVIPFTPQLRDLQQEPTRREIQVLQLVSEGLVNREIGEHLFLSEETVKSHVRHLLAKLQARSRAHAVAAGFRRGLIS